MAGYEYRLDILQRSQFIELLEDLVKIALDETLNSTFAIDGAWGSGKTFVLEEFEKRISIFHSQNLAEDIIRDKYLVFHYNCWKYDYYEEPLIAIIAAFNDCINEYKEVIDPKNKKANEIFDKTSSAIYNLTNQLIKNKIGIDLKLIEEGCNSADCAKWDSYYNFKEAIKEIKESIKEISKVNPIVIVVDELDRCIPNYAIKVLERLHHIFYDINNVVVIMAVDRIQLENSVKEIFGESVNTERYLKKFVDFTIHLDNGDLNINWHEKYAETYLKRFKKDEQEYITLNNVLKEIIKCINIREQEKIIRKAMLLDSILSKKQVVEEKDEFMCAFEVWYLMLKEYSGGCLLGGWILNEFNYGKNSISNDSKSKLMGKAVEFILSDGVIDRGRDVFLKRNISGKLIYSTFLIVDRVRYIDKNSKFDFSPRELFTGEYVLNYNDMKKYYEFYHAVQEISKIL